MEYGFVCGYALLWIEGLGATLLLVVLSLLLVRRLSRRVLRWTLMVPVVFLPFAGGLALAVIGGFVWQEGMEPAWLFPYALAWLLAFVAGVAVIFRVHSRGDVSWSPASLAVAVGIMAVFWGMTVAVMDNRIRMSFSREGIMALTEVAGLLPPPVREEDNAYNVYMEAFDRMGDREDLPGWFNSLSDPSFVPPAGEMEEFLDTHSETIALLRSAARMREYYLAVPLSIDAPIPRLTAFSYLSRLLVLDAKARAAGGDFAGAVADIKTIERMAYHVSRQPVMVAVMISASLHRTAVLSLEYVLNSGVPVPPSFRTNFASAAEPLVSAFRKAAVVDRAVIWLSLPRIGSSITVSGREHGILDPLYHIFFASHDIRAVHEYSRILDRRYSMPIHEAISEDDVFIREVEKIRGGILAEVAMPSLVSSDPFYHIADVIAMLRLADAGSAAAAFHSLRGRYPASLDELVPVSMHRIPDDPFTATPLKMKAVEGGIVIYSTGRDLVDSGGTPRDTGERKGDIAFRLGSAYEKKTFGTSGTERRKKRKK